MTLVTTSTSVYQLFFGLNGDHPDSHEATTRLSDRPIWIRLGGNIGIDGVCNNIRGGASKQNNRMMKVTRLVILMITKSNQRIIIQFLNQLLEYQDPLPSGKANTFRRNERPNAIILRDFIFQCKICRRYQESLIGLDTESGRKTWMGSNFHLNKVLTHFKSGFN